MFGLVGSALVIAQMAALSLGLPLHLAFVWARCGGLLDCSRAGT